MTMMSTVRIAIARIGQAGIDTVCGIALALAPATPSHRPQEAPRQIEGGGEPEHTEREQQPAPGIDVAEDVPRVVHEEVRLVDGGDPVERVEDRGDHEHDA